MTTLAHHLQQASLGLQAASETPRLDAELLLGKALGVARSTLHAYPERVLSAAESHQFEQDLQLRQQGYPVAYLLGEREFWSMPLAVTSATLIPRPETELLVEHALQRIPAQAAWNVIDLGTGSGAIALALAQARPQCHIFAVDRSEEALAVAKQNQQRHQLNNVTFIRSNWFSEIDTTDFDIVVSNPPYLAADDPHLTQGDIRYEPRQALVAGTTGLEDIETIAHQALNYLRPGGWLLIEHGYQQQQAIIRCFTQLGYADILPVSDLAGQPRICLGQKAELGG